MLTPVRSTQFKRDVKRAKKRGKDLSKLRTLLSLLIERRPLPASSFDHPLKGNRREIISALKSLTDISIPHIPHGVPSRSKRRLRRFFRDSSHGRLVLSRAV